MKKLAWITLILGYAIIITAPENASDTRLIISMILIGVAILAGLQSQVSKK